MRVGHKQWFYNSHYICYGMIKWDQFLSLRYKKCHLFKLKKKKKLFPKIVSQLPMAYQFKQEGPLWEMRNKGFMIELTELWELVMAPMESHSVSKESWSHECKQGTHLRLKAGHEMSESKGKLESKRINRNPEDKLETVHS